LAFLKVESKGKAEGRVSVYIYNFVEQSDTELSKKSHKKHIISTLARTLHDVFLVAFLCFMEKDSHLFLGLLELFKNPIGHLELLGLL